MVVVRETSYLGPCNVLGLWPARPRPGSSTVPILVKPHSLRARQEFTSNRVGAVRTIRRRATATCCEPPLGSKTDQ